MARRGVLVKGGVYLEEVGKLRALAVDKTGTITRSKPEVVGVSRVAGLSEEEILRHFEALLVVMKHLPDQVRSPRTSRKAEAPRAPVRPPMVERRSRPRIARPLESLSRS